MNLENYKKIYQVQSAEYSAFLKYFVKILEKFFNQKHILVKHHYTQNIKIKYENYKTVYSVVKLKNCHKKQLNKNIFVFRKIIL